MNPRWLAERLAAAATKWIGVYWGDSIPFYFVAEYPKSGGTWLAQMVGDYLHVPFPQHSLLPSIFPCVVQYFGRHHSKLRRIFYLYRDGRDVMTSLYFDRVRIARHANRPGSLRIRRTYERLLGRDYDPDDVVRHMPTFLRFEFTHPGRGSPLSWRDHVDEWVRPEYGDRIVYLSYEQLLADCATTLGSALEEVIERPVDPWRLETTIKKFSMERQTGRKPGQEDATSHIRKGVAGDWRCYFSREAAEIFQDLAGDALVRLGYEKEAGWIGRYEYPTP